MKGIAGFVWSKGQLEENPSLPESLYVPAFLQDKEATLDFALCETGVYPMDCYVISFDGE